jgi:hypothetical protein
MNKRMFFNRLDLQHRSASIRTPGARGAARSALGNSTPVSGKTAPIVGDPRCGIARYLLTAQRRKHIFLNEVRDISLIATGDMVV